MRHSASRRAFLQRASALSLAAGAAPWALTLASIGEAAAQTATDYKALVCVFLYGGNDHANTLPPFDAANHARYATLRGSIALARDTLAATALQPAVPLADGRQYALHPSLAPLLPIFVAGEMAPLLNIGTLVQPTTKAEYAARAVPLPPQWFSHNDQQSFWQSASPEGARSGWGGRIGDRIVDGNGNATFTCVSVAGNAVYLTGESAVQYQVGAAGSVAVRGLESPLFGSAACSQALYRQLTAPRNHLLEAAYAGITRRALDAHAQLSAALDGIETQTVFPESSLGGQLKMVARMIAARDALGARRQVFFVSLGGFDTHSNLTATHPGLLAEVADALAAFHAEMRLAGDGDAVTAFTASDFGRTLVANNDGSDHGWGSMQFVLGGAVNGGRYFGTPPAMASDGPDDVGQGRLLPTLAVDQLAATLALWFGVPASDLPDVVPNIGHFDTADIGLMRA